jgi:RimJ/RimL family protein N-acetyltransferase
MPLADRSLKDGSTLRISHAEPADAERLVAYASRTATESDFLTFGEGEFGVAVEEEVRFVASLEGGGAGFMLKGAVGHDIVSLAVVMRGKRPRIAHVGELGLSVAKSHWGLGAGRRMCEACIDVARTLGVTKMILDARSDNAVAIGLYERLGFVREGERTRVFRIRGEYFSAVMMGMEIG